MSLVVKYHLPSHAQERIVKSALSSEDDRQLLYQSLYKKINSKNKSFTRKQLDENLKNLRKKGEIAVDHVSKEDFELYGKYGRNDLITLIE